jgi:hypothetical protein
MLKRLGTCLFALMLSAAAGAAGTQEEPLSMIDPLLGISFDPELIHFDVFDKTADATKLLGNRDKWIFAAARDERGAAIVIVAGFHDGQSAAEHKLERDFGIVLKEDAAGLHLLGGSDYLFGKQAPVSAKAVDALMRDASVRYTAAFGGAVRLNGVLSAQGIVADAAPPPLLPHLAEQGVKFGKAEPAATPRSGY